MRRLCRNWLLWALVTSLPLALVPSDSTASSRKAEIQSVIDALDDPSWMNRCVAVIAARRKLPGWVKTADPENGNSSKIDPCSDDESVRNVFKGTFVRTTGSPNEFSVEFKTRARGEVCLVVENNGVASGRVAVNGDELLAPFDFNAVVTDLQATKELDTGEHTLTISLASAPGADIHIEIRAALADDLQQIVELVIKGLEDAGPSEAVVREILTALAEEDVALEDTQEILEELITREAGSFSSTTLLIAIRGYAEQSAELFEVGEPELDAALTTLTGILLEERSSTMRAAAAQAIARLNDPQGIPILEAALAAEPNGLAEIAIRNALGALRTTTGVLP